MSQQTASATQPHEGQKCSTPRTRAAGQAEPRRTEMPRGGTRPSLRCHNYAIPSPVTQEHSEPGNTPARNSIIDTSLEQADSWRGRRVTKKIVLVTSATGR